MGLKEQNPGNLGGSLTMCIQIVYNTLRNWLKYKRLDLIKDDIRDSFVYRCSVAKGTDYFG